MAQGRRTGRQRATEARLPAVRCPQPCGKLRFATRAEAKKGARFIRGRGAHNRMRAYPGEEGTCCDGWWHLASYVDPARVAYFRERDQ